LAHLLGVTSQRDIRSRPQAQGVHDISWEGLPRGSVGRARPGHGRGTGVLRPEARGSSAELKALDGCRMDRSTGRRHRAPSSADGWIRGADSFCGWQAVVSHASWSWLNWMWGRLTP
jgi:hypothetical protein